MTQKNKANHAITKPYARSSTKLLQYHFIVNLNFSFLSLWLSSIFLLFLFILGNLIFEKAKKPETKENDADADPMGTGSLRAAKQNG